MDARLVAVLVADRATGRFVDKTRDVLRYVQQVDGRVEIVFTGRSEPYKYGPERVRIVAPAERVHLGEGRLVEVDGVIWEKATEVCTFYGPDGAWSRVFYATGQGEAHRSRPAAQVRIITDAASSSRAAGILSYWRDIVSALGADDPLRQVYDSLNFVHPDSALGRFMAGTPIESSELGTPPIYPFRCNLSQRQAVENALTQSISVIEGPPGTGKTETILNLVANIIASGSATVGIVSFGNSAVDNVREKLETLGFGHVVARLGNKELVTEFFDRQHRRNAELKEFVNQTPLEPPFDKLAEVDSRLRRLQAAERERAGVRQEIEAYALELQHFERHVAPDELAQLDRLPLLRRSSDRILDYLAESELEGARRRGLVRRIREYLKYGSLRGLDPSETATVLRLQRAFYDRRIVELSLRLTEWTTS